MINPLLAKEEGMAIEHIQYEYEYKSRTDGATREDDKIKGSEEGKDLRPDIKALELLVLFGLGGGLLSMYYASIGYFPQVQWQESLLFLGLMAIFGSFFVLVFAALLYVPGLIWCTLLICDSHLKGALNYGLGQGQPCLKSVWQHIARPFAVYSVVLHAILLAVAALSPRMDLYGVLFVAALLGLLLPAWWFYNRLPGLLAISEEDLQSHRIKLTGFFFLSMLSGLIALWIINKINVPRAGGITVDRAVLAIVCTAVVLCVNVFVAIIHEKDRRLARGAAILGTFTLLICGDLMIHERSDRLSARTLSSYGVGYGHSATLLVKNGACRILTNGECPKDIPVKVEADILSRLGAEYFVLVQGRTVALPKDDVLDWSERDPPKQKEEEKKK